jgi:predicted transcriptional regulator
MIDGVAASETRLADLRLGDDGTCRVRIGVAEGAENRGGLNIFGREFGNHPQGIRMRVELEEQ